MTFIWLMNYFKKQKWRTRSNLKPYELEKNIRNYVGKFKSWRKSKRKGFYGRIKTFEPRTTVQLLTLLQLYPAQVRSTTPHKP